MKWGRAFRRNMQRAARKRRMEEQTKELEASIARDRDEKAMRQLERFASARPFLVKNGGY